MVRSNAVVDQKTMTRLLDWGTTNIPKICESCPLYKRRMAGNFVPAKGPVVSKLIVVGEAPGEDEVKSMAPFVGRSGQLLNSILTEVGIDRSEVFVTNAVKCRPADNATPPKEAVALCRQFLIEDLQTQPQNVPVISLGTTAYRSLSQDLRTAITKIRSSWYKAEGVAQRILASFHPAYILRNPPMRKYLLEDVAKVYTRGKPVDIGVIEGQFLRLDLSTEETKLAAETVCDWFFAASPELVLDVETNDNLNPITPDANLILVGLYSPQLARIAQFIGSSMAYLLFERLKNYKGSIIGHNLQFDIKWMIANGFEFNSAVKFEDTLLAYKIFVDENRESNTLLSFARDFNLPEFKGLFKTDLRLYNGWDLVTTSMLWSLIKDKRGKDGYII